MSGLQENQRSPSALSATVHIGTEKRCTKCGKIKKVSEFYRDNRRKNRWRSTCILCSLERTRKYQKSHREYYCDKSKSWYTENKEKKKEINAIWRKSHPENVKAMEKRNYTKRRGTLKGKLNHCMSSSINQSLKKGTKAGSHWEILVDYTVDQLKQHLERLFKPGMTWKNYGTWHIDHKIPLAAHNFITPDDIDFKRAWDLSNLQPLWASENQKKYAKLSKPFQPSLTIQRRNKYVSV